MDRSRTLKSKAVILRRVFYGETDIILTLLTPRHGKISAIAKGARRPTSKLSGYVELYTLSDMVLAQGKNMYVVSQVSLVNSFTAIGRDLEYIGYASHFSELIDRFSVDELDNHAAFDLLLAGWGWLCEDPIDLNLAARYFEMRLLNIMGYAPSLFLCALSGEKLSAQQHFYSISDGGVVSYEHGKNYPHMIPLPLPVFKIMRHFVRHNWDEIRQLQIKPQHHLVLERIMHGTFAYLLERQLKSIDFLKRVSSLNTDAE